MLAHAAHNNSMAWHLKQDKTLNLLMARHLWPCFQVMCCMLPGKSTGHPKNTISPTLINRGPSLEEIMYHVEAKLHNLNRMKVNV